MSALHELKIAVRVDDHSPWPIVLDVYAESTPRHLSAAEARDLAQELLDAAEATESRILQVKLREDNSQTYAYRDPTGGLVKLNDHVIVPVGLHGATRLGRVVGEGRGEYTGPVKDIVSRMVEEPLSA